MDLDLVSLTEPVASMIESGKPRIVVLPRQVGKPMIRPNRVALSASFMLWVLLLAGLTPAYADSVPVDGDTTAPGTGILSRRAIRDSRELSMPLMLPPRSIDETEETYTLGTMIEWLRLRGYPMDGGIRQHETDVVYTGFFLEMPDRRDAAWVEIYEYPRPTAALAFDSCQSRFAMYVPDFPSSAARDSYIRQHCQVFRLHNLVLLIDDEMHIRRFDLISRLAATMRKKAFIRVFLGFTPGNLDELRERTVYLERALSLLESARIEDYEEACNLLDEFEMNTMRDPELFGRLERARTKVGEYSRWLENRLNEQMLTFAGVENTEWLLANGYYARAAAVGDTVTLATLRAMADSAIAAAALTPINADTGPTMLLIRATVDLYFRLAPAEAVPSPEDAAGVAHCLDEVLTSSSSPLGRLWRDRYATDSYRIGEIRVIGDYAGAIVEFQGGNLSGGRAFVYLVRRDDRWSFLATGWCMVS